MDKRKSQLMNEPGCIRPGHYGRTKGWWFMNHRHKGFGSFGYFYITLDDLLLGWNVRLGERKRDEHGEYIECWNNMETR